MSEKVKLPKKVAESLDEFRDAYTGYEWMVLSEIIRSDESDRPVSHTAYLIIKYAKKSETNFVLILQALVNGYEVEETPEDKVKDLFEYFGQTIAYSGLDVQNKIRIMFNLLNVNVKGVNADE